MLIAVPVFILIGVIVIFKGLSALTTAAAAIGSTALIIETAQRMADGIRRTYQNQKLAPQSAVLKGLPTSRKNIRPERS